MVCIKRQYGIFLHLSWVAGIEGPQWRFLLHYILNTFFQLHFSRVRYRKWVYRRHFSVNFVSVINLKWQILLLLLTLQAFKNNIIRFNLFFSKLPFRTIRSLTDSILLRILNLSVFYTLVHTFFWHLHCLTKYGNQR